MGRTGVLISLSILFLRACSSQAIPNVEISVNGLDFFGGEVGGLSTKQQFGFDGKSFTLVYPQDPDLALGCPPDNTTAFLSMPVPDVEGDFVLLLDRGTCSFISKIQAAQAVGAKALLLANQLENIFNETSQELTDVCDVNCDEANSDDLATCERNCGSEFCLPAFLTEKSIEKTFCCVEDQLLSFDTGAGVQISVISLAIRDAENVVASLIDENEADGTNVYFTSEVNLAERFKRDFDPSAVILILIGTFSVSIASFIAAQGDRARVSWLWGSRPKNNEEKEAKGGPNDSPADDEPSNQPRRRSLGAVESIESFPLTGYQAMAMLICASGALVVIFFLVQKYPQQVVVGIIVMFGLGAIYSTGYFFIRPILRLFMPKSWAFAKVKPPAFTLCCLEEYYTVESIIGFVLSFSLVAVWFIFRHNLDAVWVLQNIFSVAVAIMFLSVLKLDRLSTGFYFMAAFCIYDIFMVFITPFFGDGESVMLAVATAGQGSETVIGGEEDPLLEDQGNQVCERTNDEQMPMLFLCPRFDYLGGFSLLGLGDILIPGIFLTYILRVDYFKCRLRVVELFFEHGAAQFREVGPSKFSLSMFLRAHYYFLSSVVAYCLALTAAFIANLQGWTINGVPGQPALLYIVPFVLILFLIQLGRDEISFLWNSDLEEMDEQYIAEFVIPAETKIKSRPVSHLQPLQTASADLPTTTDAEIEQVEASRESAEVDKPSV